MSSQGFDRNRGVGNLSSPDVADQTHNSLGTGQPHFAETG